MGKFVNRARMTVSGAPGTGVVTLLAADTGAETFANAGVSDGDSDLPYLLESGDKTVWEYGRGTYAAAGPTLTRTTVVKSSAGVGVAANFPTGSKATLVPQASDFGNTKETNTWAKAQTFTLAPIFSALTGYLKGNGASAMTAAASIPLDDLSGLGTSVATALAIALNTAGGLVGYSALGSAAFADVSAFDAAGTAASAVSAHAALQTGVHGISIASGKTLSASNSLTLAGTDGATLNIGAGGTLGSAAFVASAAFLPAGANGQLQYNNAGAWAPANLWRESANRLALRNGANAQGIDIYNTYTDASNYENLFIGFTSNEALLQVEKAGTGLTRDFRLNIAGLSCVWIGVSKGSIAFGDGALAAGGGQYHVAIGHNALANMTAPAAWYNIAIGDRAMEQTDTNNNSIAIGASAMRYATGGNGHVAIGGDALEYCASGVKNVIVGGAAAYKLDGSYNVVVGTEAMRGASVAFDSDLNTVIGHAAGYSMTNSTGRNTIVGGYAGYYLTTGIGNVFIGYIDSDPGQVTTGSYNIIIGYYAGVADGTASNQLSIGNLIYGAGLDGTGATISSGSIGIGTKAPTTKLDVAGDVQATNFIVNGVSHLYSRAVGNYDILEARNGSRFQQLDLFYAWTDAANRAAGYLATTTDGLFDIGTYASGSYVGAQASDISISPLEALGLYLTKQSDGARVGVRTNVPLAPFDVLNDSETISRYGIVRIHALIDSNGHFSAAAAPEDSIYLQIGGGDWALHSYRMIGFGYAYGADPISPAMIGYQETSESSSTKGDLVFLTRDVTTNTAPSERLRIRSDGVLFIADTTAPGANPTGGGYFFVESGALKYRGSSGTVTTIANA
jgi:hypothetical protein